LEGWFGWTLEVKIGCVYGILVGEDVEIWGAA